MKSKVKSQRSKVKTVKAEKMATPSFLIAVVGVLAVFFASCGYKFAGVAQLPQGIKTLSFAEFENQTLEPGVEKELQWAFEREFRTYGGIRVSPQGEGIVNVVLRDVYFRPNTFDRRDQVLEYEAALAFDITLTHRDTGELLWQASNIRVQEDSSAVPQVALTTSPDFLQGTLDPGDLSNFTDIQFAETQRRLSLERLLKEAAQEAYYQIGENF